MIEAKHVVANAIHARVGFYNQFCAVIVANDSIFFIYFFASGVGSKINDRSPFISNFLVPKSRGESDLRS